MNILITRHDKIGDFVTMLPVCKVLKAQTSHNIVMLVSKVNIALAKKLDFIDGVIEYRANSKDMIEEIKSYNFDTSISGYINFELGKSLMIAKIPKRIAPATKIAQILFNKRIKQRRSEVKKREFEYNLDLVKVFDDSLSLEFDKPLLNFDLPRENMIIFHVGSGGSSDGNLSLDDYLLLASKASTQTDIVFTFGRDDTSDMEYIKSNLNFKAEIRDDFEDIYQLTKYIAQSKLFISTSTGPMHLAGVTNTPTLSFFGNRPFASSSRWGTVSDESLQNNFEIDNDYDIKMYQKIENRLMELIR